MAWPLWAGSLVLVCLVACARVDGLPVEEGAPKAQQSVLTTQFIMNTYAGGAIPLDGDSGSHAKPTVELDSGVVEGRFVRGGKVREFLGIPYAQPPVGKLRLHDPAPVQPWGKQTLVANKVRAGCLQRCELMKLACPDEVSEDCLYANVWAPATKSKELLPVYVFIHGGNFLFSNAGVQYNGTRLGTLGIVTVTFNYRLGLLGFLTTPKLEGNFGFKDQQFLLDWVHRNIKAFGGDPNRVTLGGQSAGAISTSAHLVSPSSRKYIHQAVLQSAFLGIPLMRRPESNVLVSTHALTKLGCGATDVDCLRAASPEAILAAQKFAIDEAQDPLNVAKSTFSTSLFLPFSPVVEGESPIPDQPLRAIQQGAVGRMPILAGFTKDESASFVKSFLPQVGSIEYNTLLVLLFGIRGSSRVREVYPASDEADQRRMIQEWARDLFISCSLHNATLHMENAFTYRFDHVMRDSNVWREYSPLCSDSACHSSELQPVFHGAESFDALGAESTPGERQLAEQMLVAWSHFIRTGNPNHAPPAPAPVPSTTLPVTWPAHDAKSDLFWIIEDPPAVAVGVNAKRCGLWDETGYFW